MAVTAKGAITQIEKGRARDFTPKQRKFLKLLAEQEFKNPQECATKAGYKGEYWNVVHALRDEIQTLATMILVGSAPEAALRLTTLMSSDAPIPNAQMKLQAAKEILDRSGVVKQEQVSVDHTVKGGLFLLPVKHQILEEVEDAEYTEG